MPHKSTISLESTYSKWSERPRIGLTSQTQLYTINVRFILNTQPDNVVCWKRGPTSLGFRPFLMAPGDEKRAAAERSALAALPNKPFPSSIRQTTDRLSLPISPPPYPPFLPLLRPTKEGPLCCRSGRKKEMQADFRALHEVPHYPVLLIFLLRLWILPIEMETNTETFFKDGKNDGDLATTRRSFFQSERGLVFAPVTKNVPTRHFFPIVLKKIWSFINTACKIGIRCVCANLRFCPKLSSRVNICGISISRPVRSANSAKYGKSVLRREEGRDRAGIFCLEKKREI